MLLTIPRNTSCCAA